MKIKNKVFIFLTIIISITLPLYFFYKKRTTKEISFVFYAENSFENEVETAYKVIDNGIKKFEKTHPNIKIKYTTGILKEDYQSVINDMILKGNTPDVMLIASGDIHNYIRLETLEPLDDRFKKEDLIYSSALSTGMYNGKLYGLPFEINPMVMAINKDILLKCGISNIPNEYSVYEFYNYSRLVKNKGFHSSCEYRLENIVDAFTKRITNEQGTEGYIGSKSFVNAIKYMYNLNAIENIYSLSRDDFFNGKVAFMPMKYSRYSLYKKYPYNAKNYLDFNIGCLAMPNYDENTNNATLDSSLLCMSRFSDNKDLSYEFIEFLATDKEVQLDIFKYSAGVSTMPSVLASSELINLLKDKYGGNLEDDIGTLDYAILHSKSKPKFNTYKELISYLESEVKKIINESKDIDLSIKILQKNVDNIIGK